MLSKHLQSYSHCTGTSTAVPGRQGHRCTYHRGIPPVTRRPPEDKQKPLPTFSQKPHCRHRRHAEPGRAVPAAQRSLPRPALARRAALPSRPGGGEARGRRATCRLGLLRPRKVGAHEGPGVLLGGELLEASGRELVHLLLTLRPATQGAGVRLARGRPGGGSPRCPAAALTRCGRRPAAGPCAPRRTCYRPWRQNRTD